ncbi:hypothetical protein C8Q75DRAFT_805469 [Abortiporus biennis]|nr:hypothetical protein C8Q75DRAFT_805469 [Abortiporus biennis]
MARRAAPPGAGPALFGPGRPQRALHDPNESAFSTFMREEIFAPEKLAGNINILTGLAVFFGGIFATRTWAGYFSMAFTMSVDELGVRQLSTCSCLDRPSRTNEISYIFMIVLSFSV